MKGKKPTTKTAPLLARLSFRFEGEIKSYISKQKLKEFSNTKSALQEKLKGLLQEKKEATTRIMKIMKRKSHW